MKLLWGDKDGGPESKVYCWGFELKGLFSILLLKFEQGSREAFHSHAFNSISWVLRGQLLECIVGPDTGPYAGAPYFVPHPPSWKPIITKRDTYHKVLGIASNTWALTFRGPWVDEWKEATPTDGEYTLTHGRKRMP